jgi:hypothetical protein
MTCDCNTAGLWRRTCNLRRENFKAQIKINVISFPFPSFVSSFFFSISPPPFPAPLSLCLSPLLLPTPYLFPSSLPLKPLLLVLLPLLHLFLPFTTVFSFFFISSSFSRFLCSSDSFLLRRIFFPSHPISLYFLPITIIIYIIFSVLVRRVLYSHFFPIHFSPINLTFYSLRQWQRCKINWYRDRIKRTHLLSCVISWPPFCCKTCKQTNEYRQSRGSMSAPNYAV